MASRRAQIRLEPAEVSSFFLNATGVGNENIGPPHQVDKWHVFQRIHEGDVGAAARPISTPASSQVSRTAARAERASFAPNTSVPHSTLQAKRSGGSMAPPGKT